MGKSSRRKGAYHERAWLDILPGSTRIARSGYPGPDLEWCGYLVEVKYRKDATGFTSLYRWMKDAQILALSARGKDKLLVMRPETLQDMLDDVH